MTAWKVTQVNAYTRHFDAKGTRVRATVVVEARAPGTGSLDSPRVGDTLDSRRKKR